MKAKVIEAACADVVPWGVWRYYAPADLVTEGDEPLPPGAAKVICELTGYSSPEGLNRDIGKHARGEIPEPLQSRLAQIFFASCDPEATKEPLEILLGGKTYKVAYPFVCTGNERIELTIAALTLTQEADDDSLAISARIAVSAPELLRPRMPADAELCALLLPRGGDFAEHTQVVGSWLTRSGLDVRIASKVATSVDLLFDLELHIRDRIETLLSVTGSQALVGDRSYTYLNGEEENGFSRSTGT